MTNLQNAIRTTAPGYWHRAKFILFKPKPRFAHRAFTKTGVSLQDRLTFALNACRAKKMRGFFALCILAQAIHQRTGWGFPKLVAVKIGAETLKLSELCLKRQNQELQLRIRDLRICYLITEFAQGEFDLRICTRLRRLEKTLHLIETCRDFSSCLPGLSGQPHYLTETIEVEFQNYLQCNHKISQCRQHTATDSQ